MKKIVVLYLIIALVSAESCSADDDCDSYYYCDSGSCEHKEIFPMKTLEIIGTILIVIVSALSNSSGIGGGGLNVLICILFFKFEASNSVPLSQVIILGGSLTTIMIQIPSRHPTRDRPLIDYDLIAFVISPMLLGASIGVILNKSFPSWLILALLTILLAFMLHNSIKKYNTLSKKEAELRNKKNIDEKSNLIPTKEQEILEQPITENLTINCEIEKTKEQENIEQPISENLIIKYDIDSRETANTLSDENSNKPKIKKVNNIYKEESGIIPVQQFCVILVILGIAILGSLMKGGEDLDSILGFSQCSTYYWVFLSFFFIILLAICFIAEIIAIRKVNRKIEQDYDFDDHDIKWNLKTASYLSFFTIIAGITASLLGLGGGLVMNPIMLNIGYRPEVSTASSSFLVLMASIIAVLQFSLAGDVIFSYGLWLFFTSMVGSMLGTFFILQTASKYKRVSLIVLILAIILFMCIITIPLYGIIEMATGGITQYGFEGLC